METQVIPYYQYPLGCRKLHIGGYSDVGPKRAENQDTIGANGNLFVVADGVSRTQEPKRSSEKAVQDVLYAANKRNGTVINSLESAVQRANRLQFEEQKSELKRGECRFATTLTALRIYSEGAKYSNKEKRLHYPAEAIQMLDNKSPQLYEENDCLSAEYVNVGDSRLYAGNSATEILRRVTKDQTLLQWMIEQGREEELKNLIGGRTRAQNTLTQAIGMKPDVSVQGATQYPVQSGRVFLLCTDGLSNAGKPAERRRLLYTLMKQRRNEEYIARALVEFANTEYGRDNASAIVVRVE